MFRLQANRWQYCSTRFAANAKTPAKKKNGWEEKEEKKRKSFPGFVTDVANEHLSSGSRIHLGNKVTAPVDPPFYLFFVGVC